MENEEFGIDKNFIDVQAYKKVSQKAKRRNALYDNYLQILQKIYQHYRQFFEETIDLLANKKHEKSIYLKEFKSFLRSITDIIKDTSIFQIDCITEVRVNKDQTIDQATIDLVQKVQSYSGPQQKFRDELRELNSFKQQTEKFYSNLKTQSSEAFHYYNTKLMMGKKKAIVELLGKVTNLQQSLNSSRGQISSNACDFEKYLLQFRKRLFKNKYNMLKKILQTSKQSRDSLTQILLFLVACVTQKLQEYIKMVKHPKSDDLSISQSKGKKKGNEDPDVIVSNMISSIQEYNIIMEELEMILKGFDEGLKRLGKRVKDVIDGNSKVFLENMNNLYEIDENPSAEVTKTFDLFSYFTQKFASISDKLYVSTTKLYMLKTNVKKHAEVTLTLIRYNVDKGKSYSGDKNSQIDRLYQQISYDYLIDIITQVYHSFKDILGDMKNFFNQHTYKKKKNKIQNSMQLSHVEETFHIIQKKPCKNEIWLWRDWRDKVSFAFDSSAQTFKSIETFLKQFREEEEKKELQNYECILVSKKDIKGVLKICQTYLQFISITQTPSISLFIPFNQIRQVDIRVKIFEKILNFQTEKGDLVFSNLSDIQGTKEYITEKIQSGDQSKKQVVKKASVELSAEEMQAIAKRKSEIEKERIDTSEMQKITGIFVDGVKIDQVYDTIYSDKEFTLKGKPEDCFFSYSMKKAKNFNYISRPYDKPGPQFYTLNKDVNFVNCPIYSTRMVDFDHPLPPIPFMPKSCHCEETGKIYWISNEEFDYYAHSKSSGAPYADTFEVKIIHKIKVKNGGVSIDLYGALIFVKETGMKSMLKSKGEKEMIDGGLFTMSQIEKTLKMLVGSANSSLRSSSVTDSKLLKSTGIPNGEQSSNEISKLKYQNKLLIICLVVVFLANIIIKFVINS